MKNKTVAILCAMEKEASLLRENMKNHSVETWGRLRFETGEVGENRVILSVCGIGLAAAAAAAAALLMRYTPDYLINSGVAGSLSERVSVLDLVIADEVCQHDMDTSPLGDPVGFLSGPNCIELPTDTALREALLAAAKKLGHPAVTGKIASGDQFIADREKKEAIRRLFSPLACEMEGAGVVRAAYAAGVPCAVLRAISDSYDGKNEMEYALFAEKAANVSARVLLTLLGG